MMTTKNMLPPNTILNTFDKVVFNLPQLNHAATYPNVVDSGLGTGQELPSTGSVKVPHGACLHPFQVLPLDISSCFERLVSSYRTTRAGVGLR